MRKNLLCLTITMLLSIAASAQVTMRFLNITNNNPANAAIGERQLLVTLTDRAGQALFTFGNMGDLDRDQCVITDIYYEDSASLLSFDSFGTSAPMVAYNVLSPPPPLNLPGGNQPFVNFEESYGFTPDNPASQWGIGNDRSQEILFNINTGTFQTIEDALITGDLRIGIHVIGFEDGGSESFVSYIPAPGALVLGLLGTSILGIIRKRRY